jgi:hypothetical protein
MALRGQTPDEGWPRKTRRPSDQVASTGASSSTKYNRADGPFCKSWKEDEFSRTRGRRVNAILEFRPTILHVATNEAD